MSKATLSKLFIAALLLTAGAAQAAGPTSVSEIPAAWYADRILTNVPTAGAASNVFPSAAYEHGTTITRSAAVGRVRPGIAGMTQAFPTSSYENGPVL